MKDVVFVRAKLARTQQNFIFTALEEITAMRSEQDLVTQAIAGDTEAFGELYGLHRESIYRYIIVRVESAAEAEDLTGQVFLKAWEALPGYEQREARFSSWLYQIARNLVIDHQRARKPV